MNSGESRAGSRQAALELPSVMLIAWLAFISIPLGLGEIGLSWDALNHHIYLGWTAEQPRFDKDFLAASYQSYQYPYLYWPVYRLSLTHLSGAWVGVALATLHLVAVPPVWMIARACVPGATSHDAFMRFLAVTFAFMSVVVLSMFDSTSNDLLAAAPLVWAIAFSIQPLVAGTSSGSVRAAIVLSGVFGGLAVAFKLSNGPLVLLLPMVWLLPKADGLRQRLFNVLLGCMATVAACALSYGYWGWQLWSHFGNPIYPFYDSWFDALRAATGWKP